MVREQVDRFTTSDGTQLRVADSGAGDGTGGPTLVLVHGWSQDLRTWDRVVDDLRRTGFAGRILRYDHRGHGGSDAAAEGRRAALGNPHHREMIRWAGEKIMPFLDEAGLVGHPGMSCWRASFLLGER